jgi:hypothetical protein
MLEHGTIKWFDFSDGDEKGSYHSIWINSSFKRPHDHPSFLEMMKPAGYCPIAVVYQHSCASRVVYTFNSCCLNDLSAFNKLENKFMHLVSPYGYGGPLYEGNFDEFEAASKQFENLFSQELTQRGFVTEFVREDIFCDRLVKRSVGQVIEQQPNVVVRLEREPDDIWQEYKSKVRKNVNRAIGHGLRVEFDRAGDRLDDFLKIYYETMDRTNASKNFYLSSESFQTLGTSLGKDGGLLYVHVYDGDDIISTELLLLSNDTIYSFLGGTFASAFDKRPNDLLKHEVILWGAQQGFKWYVLGGGATPGDGIYKYKEAFDKESIFPFSVRRIIHNPDAYELLMQTRAKYEKCQGNEWKPNPDFFPEYLS